VYDECLRGCRNIFQTGVFAYPSEYPKLTQNILIDMQITFITYMIYKYLCANERVAGVPRFPCTIFAFFLSHTRTSDTISRKKSVYSSGLKMLLEQKQSIGIVSSYISKNRRIFFKKHELHEIFSTWSVYYRPIAKIVDRVRFRSARIFIWQISLRWKINDCFNMCCSYFFLETY